MASAPQPSPAKQFGKYSLIERIAVGGMAEVYRAKTYGAAGFEKDLVIKRILERFSDDNEFVRMFIDEARLAARLQHPNLVQIFDFDRIEVPGGTSYYIAMEWVDGKDLRQILKEMVRQKKPIPYAAAVHIAIETLRGLHYAHTKIDGGQALDIVHRDVSPHNVLVSYSGDVKLSDFGIAKAAARASATSNGMVKGKLAYMSPEQITGQVLDRRSDVYSMGIVLFEMLTRTRLYSGESEVEVIGKVRDGAVPPPRSRNPDIPVDLEQVLLKMLTRDLSVRYQSAAEAAKALSGTSVHSPTEALALGEFVAALFPPGQRAAVVETPSPAVVHNILATTPRKSENMANQSSNPPSGKPPQGPNELSGAATVMLEAPVIPSAPAPQSAPAAAASPPKAAPPIADQKTAILDAGSPQMAQVHAQIAEARAKAAGGAPPPAASAPPAAAPITDQKTAILDASSPQMASVHAQIAEARAKAGGGAPPPAAAPITDQKTAILDTASPQMASMQAQLAEARAKAGGGAPPPVAARPMPGSMSDQRTAILDTNSPAHAGVAAQVAAARAGAAAPAGGAARTMALDVSAQGPMRPAPMPAQQLRPLASSKAPSTALRWVLGPVITVVTCGVTYAAAGALFPGDAVRDQFKKPPVVIKMGRIKLETSPPGASVIVDGKPHQHFTPTEIEGPVGETTAHLVVKLDGFQTFEQDVMFAERTQPLSIPLLKLDSDPRKAKHTGSGTGAAPTSGKDKDKGSIEMVSDKGMIGILIEPEATVTVDGQLIGKTPIGAHPLKPGMHTFLLTNPKLGKSEKLRIEIFSGENPPIVRNWNAKH